MKQNHNQRIIAHKNQKHETSFTYQLFTKRQNFRLVKIEKAFADDKITVTKTWNLN